jgi:CheY-like chemotaxis protein
MNSNTLTTLVVDDEELARLRLQSWSGTIPKRLNCCEAKNGEEHEKKPNETGLVFLDIHMPPLTDLMCEGLGILRRLFFAHPTTNLR